LQLPLKRSVADNNCEKQMGRQYAFLKTELNAPFYFFVMVGLLFFNNVLPAADIKFYGAFLHEISVVLLSLLL